MLHRVISNRSMMDINRRIEITPEFLDKTLLSYKNRGYQFVSLDKALEILASPPFRKNKPFVCFTFDDGYVDNYLNALPVFEKYNCPFTIYVTTDFPENKAFLWWYILDDILMNNESLLLADGSVYSTSNIAEKNNVFHLIHGRLSKIAPSKLEETFKYWFKNYEFSAKSKVNELSLNYDQLIVLSNHNLCTIGSHTVSHPNLSLLSKNEQENEMRKSKEVLEQLLRKEISHFAYPFGAHNTDSIIAAENAGYKTATIAWGGEVRYKHNNWRLYRTNLEQK